MSHTEIKSLDESKAAALALGAALDEENVSYAIIGGTACCLYGSTRGTIDLDVVVALPGSEVMSLKLRIARKGARSLGFGPSGGGLYYRQTIPIEVLPIDAFTWPSPLQDACRSMALWGGRINVLAPPAIIFSKSRRAVTNVESDRPKTRERFSNDVGDMVYLLSITSDTESLQTFALYSAVNQDKIRVAVCKLAVTQPSLQDIATLLNEACDSRKVK